MKRRVGDEPLIFDKLQRAIERGYFRTLDLFAGCGGMSLGFDRAGFRSVASVEINDHARASHEMNFAPLVPEGEYRSFSDITALDPDEVVAHLPGQSPKGCTPKPRKRLTRRPSEGSCPRGRSPSLDVSLSVVRVFGTICGVS